MFKVLCYLRIYTPRGQGFFCLFYLLLCPQSLKYCLAYSTKYLINLCCLRLNQEYTSNFTTRADVDIMRRKILSSMRFQRREKAHPVVIRNDFMESYYLN